MNVYHFTKFDSLLKILKSGKIFFGNLKYANDPSEGLYPATVIENCLRDICESESEFRNIVAFFNINTISNENLNVYSISLTSVLSNIHMWMEYGDYARGVAIAFDVEKLLELLNKETKEYLAFKPVQYDKQAVKDLVEGIYRKNKQNNEFLEMEYAILALYPFLKDKSYRTEKELRIAFVHSEPDTSPNSNEMLFGWDYGTRHYYLNVKLLIKSGVMKTICLGSNMTLYEKKILEDLLKALNINIRLKINLIPVSKKERQ